MNKQPIGIFDSGLGGLTVVKEIEKILPNESIVYLGDTARVPYGTRSKEIITKFSFEDAIFLLSKNVKCIVIACNTSSAMAGTELKNELKIPVFDVITPALNDARRISKSGNIGAIGTRGTIDSGAYSVPFLKTCSLFVPFIEEGVIDGEALKLVAKEYLSDFNKENIDTIILGCTHYPIIKNIIKEELNKDINLIDPGESVAKVLKEYLINNKMQNTDGKPGERNYFVTDYTERFIKIAELFLGHKIERNLKKVLL